MRILKTIPTLVLALSILFPFVTYVGHAAEVAPGFSLLDPDGNTVNLNSYRGKVVLLTFWTTWCASCRAELPDLEALHNKFFKDGFTVLSVCVEPSAAIVTGYLHHHPVSFPVLIDQRGEVADTYRLSGFPASFILGKDGLIRHKHLGYEKKDLALYAKEIIDLLKQ